jgi:transposase
LGRSALAEQIDVIKTVSPDIDRINVDKTKPIFERRNRMSLYIGVDFHPHQQTVAWCDRRTGEIRTLKLAHDLEKVREFYSSLPGPAVIGIEASSRAVWFENMLFEIGHKLFVGDPVLIRKRAVSRHKNDRRDAELILSLLIKEEFPALWRRPRESEQILSILRLRSNLVRQRTQVYNRLQALAHSAGFPKGQMRTAFFQSLLKKIDMDEAESLSRAHYFRLLDSLCRQIDELNEWLKKKADNVSVELLMTQKGVGYLTSLTVVHTLGDITRFTKPAKQVVKLAGLDSLEDSSAGRIRFGHVSKAGSPLLRFQLGQSAQIAARYDARLKAFYKRLAKKKPKAVAKTAAARKLLVKLTIMLRDNITADEFDRRGRAVGNARFSPGSEMAVY